MSLQKRVQTAFLLLIPVAAILFIGGLLLTVLTFLVHVRVNYEFFSLVKPRSFAHRCQLTILSSLLPLSFVMYGVQAFFAAFLIAVMLSLLLEMLQVEKEIHSESHELLLGNAAMGFCYTGVLGTALVYAASMQQQEILAWFLVCVISADTFAYFGGRAFGRNKLAPRLSPAKTVEGALCGILGSVLISTAMGWLLQANLPLMALWGLVVSVLAISGDLIESMFKRFYGVKDTAALLPGHGGLLDRVDALLFASPVLFFVAF